MDVRCERCRAQYVFDDDQVTAAGLTVQCTNCGHLFKVKKKELVVTVPVLPEDLRGTPLPATSASLRPSGTQAAMPAAPPRTHSSIPAMPAAQAPEPEQQREWRVRQATGNVFTFRELTTLQKWIIEQRVGRDDEISQTGEAWNRLGDIAELASFFQVVEAAERSRSQPALPAITGFTPAPPPAYGSAVQTTPAPPSGFPPPSFTSLPAQPALPQAPAHDVDVTFDDERPRARRSSSRVWLAAVGAALLAGGGAVVIVPRLVSRPPPPAPVVVAPAPAPAPAPEAAPPPPAPEPVVPPAPAEVSKPPPAPRGPKVLLARARVLQEKGETEEALELFGRVASDEPENVEAQAGRGLCYLDLENWAPAEASFQAALRLEPDHADALLGLAETYRFQGKNAEAIPAYERYLARYPDGEEAQVAKQALAELRK